MQENLLELPRIESSSYDCTSSVVGSVIPANRMVGYSGIDTFMQEPPTLEELMQPNKKIKEPEIVTKRRIVNIYVVDADERVPLDKAVLYKEEGLVTEDADSDILYNLDIRGMLDMHNAIRIATIDEDASSSKERDVFLKEVKASQLSLKIVTIVAF